jgi:hypothetical protein
VRVLGTHLGPCSLRLATSDLARLSEELVQRASGGDPAKIARLKRLAALEAGVPVDAEFSNRASLPIIRDIRPRKARLPEGFDLRSSRVPGQSERDPFGLPFYRLSALAFLKNRIVTVPIPTTASARAMYKIAGCCSLQGLGDGGFSR